MKVIEQVAYTQIRVGGPPANWKDLLVVDLKTKCLVYQIKEANIAEGWIERYIDEIPDNLDNWPYERIHGEFAICQIVEVPEIKGREDIQDED